jgi:cell division septum initiation protein DivIVA
MVIESTNKYEISVSELNTFLDLCNKAIEGLSGASKIPKEQRKQVREAIGNTCELIDSILTTVKQRLSDTRKAVLGNSRYAADMISGLNNIGEWENSYRQFQICVPLREAASELREGVLGKLVQYFSFKNTDELKNTIEKFLATEATAGEFVRRILENLADLETKIDSDRAMVADELQHAKQKVQSYRDQFIDLEKKVRSTI